jgi:hypothetical protein
MGCLMKEKIQGLAERKAFILLFLIVWELCSSSGNLTYRYSPPPLPLLTGLFNEHLITSNNSIHCTDHRISGRCPVAEIPSPPHPLVGLEKGGGGGGAEGWGEVQLT